MAGSDGSDDGPRWRVFISRTSELEDFPKGQSYVAKVERAVSAAGHVVVDMADFPAADQSPARVCVERVCGCDVYVGLLGTRYGSPVRDKPEVSYTELEFDSATGAGLDRLVFLLDTDAADVGIPLSKLIDREFGPRQDAFRRRVRDSGLTTQSFANPDALGQLVERSLRDLAETWRRIGSGIRREKLPAEPQPVRASRFVNPAPAPVPSWFQDRQVETGLLARYVTDPGIRLVTIEGRGGIGKTAMVCRLLKELEAGRIPDMEGHFTEITMGGIVYLSRNGVHNVQYPDLVADLLRLLPAETGQRLQRLYQDPRHSPVGVMLALLEDFPAGAPVVVLLDNLESVMDAERETLTEPALHEALSAVLTAPEHAVTVIATTRVRPAALLNVEPARQRQLRLEHGLGSPEAETVLRALDDDGHLGLRDAPDELLDGLRRYTLGFPKALEAVKAILDGDDRLTPRDLLDRARRLPEDQVIQVLVGEAYKLLGVPAQQVMQALSVYPAPVPAVGVDFLLLPVSPTIDAEPILTRLVRRQLVRFQEDHYYLQPVDRDYARGQLRSGNPGDSPGAFTLTGLQLRAADYYARIRAPRESWCSLDDVRPQLAEYELRCDAGDYDTAATVLCDILIDCLWVWGHYRTLVDLHERIHRRITDPAVNAAHMKSLGDCHFTLGHYRQAIDLYGQALAIARDTSNRPIEGDALANLGNCHTELSDYRQANDLYGQALAIARDIGNRPIEGDALAGLANCHFSLGDYRQAIDWHIQALAIARDTDNCPVESAELGNLGYCYYNLGDYRQAIDLSNQALAIARDIGYRLVEGHALGYLANCYYSLGDYAHAIDLHTQSLAIHRDIGYRRAEGNGLLYLADCEHSQGDYPHAIDLCNQALAIHRDIGYRCGEAKALECLGRAWLASGDARQAIELLNQAVSIADTTGDIEPLAKARSSLARAHLQLGDLAAALATTTEQELPYPTEDPTTHLLKGLALLGLHRSGDSVAAFSDALTAADMLLKLADSNVAALCVRALALSGVAAVTGDPTQAKEAAKAFARAHTVTSALGVAAETDRLLDVIASQDESGILADVRTAQDCDAHKAK